MKNIFLLAIIALLFSCKTKSKTGGQTSSNETTVPADCVDTDNPFAVEWMDKALDYHNPTQVFKYKVEEKWQYLFQSLPNGYLYDCQGVFICETQNDHDPCHEEYIALLGRGKIIWQGEGIWD